MVQIERITKVDFMYLVQNILLFLLLIDRGQTQITSNIDNQNSKGELSSLYFRLSSYKFVDMKEYALRFSSFCRMQIIETLSNLSIKVSPKNMLPLYILTISKQPAMVYQKELCLIKLHWKDNPNVGNYSHNITRKAYWKSRIIMLKPLSGFTY